MTKYVPLHLHTEYSLLDGAIRLKDLCAFAKQNDMPAVAITDHGVMYGAMEFCKIAKEAGVKPIIGCEFYVYEGDIKEKKSTQNELFHLVLLAKSKKGYENLVKLASIAAVDGFYYKPRINHKLLEEYKEDLICLSACVQGEVAKYILKGNKDEAKKRAEYYKSLFGEDYYIEIQDHGLDVQKRSNPDLIRIANELGIKLVITNDSHYLQKDDANWHDTLLCLQTNASKDDDSRFRFPNNEFYVKNVSELRDAFKWLDSEVFEQAIKNTVDIAEKCHFMLDKGRAPLPNFEVPAGYTVDSYLHYQVIEGLKKLYGEITPELKERYQYELGIIEQMGFSAYFLITWDFIKFAKDNDIPVGPGRGSAAGSLVAYALGITDLDPIKHNLLFERFLNPERYTMPDIDIDFCIERRGEVIDYVAKKYGTDKVCQIITFGTLAAKAALKGVARVYNIPFADANKWSQLIPSGPKVHIDDALQPGMELKELYDANPQVKEIVDMAKQLEGIKVNFGMHAAGVIISYMPLNEIVPVQPSKEGIIITQYPMSDLETLGLLKMDFLGLRNLTMINHTLKLIKKRHGIDIEINKIPLDDEKTYELLQRGDTDGVFQLESSGMKNLVRRLKPNVFEDMGALVALFRPGPLDSGMVDDFVERKHGRQKVVYAHDLLVPILKDTYGTIVYQEQIMQIFQALAGYTLGQADMVRRMMGKKKFEEMAKQKEKFIEGSAKNGMSAKDATELFEQIEKFAAYCFNRSHSAAYAFVSYQTAYLKAHYFVEYMSALLSSVKGDQDKTQMYIAECQKHGVKVLAPDINKSYSDFSPDEDNIRFGLGAIKNVGEAVIENICSERELNGEFKSFYDFCTRVDMKSLNKRTLESLIKAGAFANIEKSKKQLMYNLDSIVAQAQRENEAKSLGQASLFASLGANSGFGGGSYVLQGDDSEYTDKEIQQYEKEYLGFYVTSHPLSSIRNSLPFLTTHNIAELAEMPSDKLVTICGLLSQVRQVPFKKDPTKFLKAGMIEDLTGKVEFVVFYKTLLEVNSFVENEQKVIFSGKIQRKDEDQLNIIVDSVKPVENSNVVTLTIKKNIPFEILMSLKDTVLRFKGSDPLLFKLDNMDGEKILAGSGFWVNANNDLVNTVVSNYDEFVDIGIKSLDN